MNAMHETNENALFVFPILRTCAHCGGDARYEYPRSVTNETGVWIECDDCGACSDVHYHDDEGVAVLYAAQAWNRRAAPHHARGVFPADWQMVREDAGTIIVASPTGDAYTFTRGGDAACAFLWKFLTAVIDAKQTKAVYPAL